MFRTLYVGASGMAALETDMLTITNNVANSKTTAFKKSRVDLENIFPQVLSEAQKNVSLNTVEPAGIELGSGVRVTSTPKDFQQGTIEVTTNDLDMAISGRGFFVLRNALGTPVYSRAGNFHRDSYGNVVDPNGNLLEPGLVIPENASSIRIAPDGTTYVLMTGSTTESAIGQIVLADFANPSGLESLGQNVYNETLSSGPATVGYGGKDNFGKVSQFALEASNVDIIDEMMQMIITQRAFDVISKAIQSGEGMLKSAIDISKG